MIAIMFMDLLDDPADEPQFTQMCEHYKNYIYSVCFNRLHDAHLAEDCTWQTFEQAAKQFHKFDEDYLSNRVKNLLCTIAIAKCSREYMKQKRFYETGEKLAEGQKEEAAVSSVEEAFWQQWERGELVKAINRLPEHYKVPLFLAKIYGFSSKEIAQICEVTPNTARKRVSLAMKEVRSILEGEHKGNEE
ncbi:MAG: sigma-70 family RNA polymerase sigma factor [Clostridia bacterium]|nr:sigma-70 family RNA polymerase sigma factor [Clostridia bacterium]